MMVLILTFKFACLVYLFEFVCSYEIMAEVRKDYYWFPDLDALMTHSEAKAFCVKYGMELATVRTAEEQSIFDVLAQGKTASGNQGYTFWTQAVWDKDRKEFMWDDGTPLTYKNWNFADQEKRRASTSAPNNYAVISSAYTSPGGGKWAITVDTNVLYPLCEKYLVYYYNQQHN